MRKKENKSAPKIYVKKKHGIVYLMNARLRLSLYFCT